MHTFARAAVVLATLVALSSLLLGGGGDGPGTPKGPPRLLLVPGVDGVLGWVDGDRTELPDAVEVELGPSSRRVRLGRDGTFFVEAEVDAPTALVARVGELEQRLVLRPREASDPVAYVVTDRPVYRPGDELRFVAFLRALDPRGDWQPLESRAAAVEIVSVSQGTIAARLELVSDGAGRVEGAYRFQAEDPLDAYEVRVDEHRGGATVELAEFRKSKVRLDVEAVREGRTVALEFATRDFLGETVPGTALRWSARVQRVAASVEEPLDSSVFALAPETPLLLDRASALSEDERFLWRSGEELPMHTAGSVVVAWLDGEVHLGDDGVGSDELAVERAWLSGGYELVLDAVVVDHHGHEQRAHRRIPLGGETRACDLELELENVRLAGGAPAELDVRVLDADGNAVAARAAVSAERIVSELVDPWAYGYYGYPVWPWWQDGGSRTARGRPHRPAWNRRPHDSGQLRYEPVTLAPVLDGRAVVPLDEPGAYRLRVVAHTEDGRTLENEVRCEVLDPGLGVPLELRLAEASVDAGAPVRGDLRGDAPSGRALVVLRDPTGIRSWQVVAMGSEPSAFARRVPSDAGYGSRVDAYAFHADGTPRTDGSDLFVRAGEREIDVELLVPDTVGPGEEVEVEVRVDRPGARVVLAVYDHSLLGVAPDRSVDPRDFFHADTRLLEATDHDRLAALLSRWTIGDLVDRAESQAEDGDATYEAVEQHLRSSDWFPVQQLPLLFELAGVRAVRDTRGDSMGWGDSLRIPRGADGALDAPLAELFRDAGSDWRFEFRLHGGVLRWGVFHESWYVDRPWFLDSGPGLGALGGAGYGGGRARGDAHFSVAGNALHSQLGAVSGQALASDWSHDAPGAAGHEGGSVRVNFSDAAYWDAGLVADRRGRVTARFRLPDSLTNWRVVAVALDDVGRAGRTVAGFRSFQPIMVWPMVPRIFTEGDTAEVWAAVHNRTAEEQRVDVALQVSSGRIEGSTAHAVRIAPGEHARVTWRFLPDRPGAVDLLMSATCAAGEDASLKRLPVRPLVVEDVLTWAGFARGAVELDIPEHVDRTAARLELRIVPGVVEDVLDTLDWLVEYPHGCVEQTMSRFLPALLVDRTLRVLDRADPELQARLPEVMEAGVKRLLALQKEDGSWGWYAASQTHEMLTPYALYGLLLADQAGWEIPNDDALERGLDRVESFLAWMPTDAAADWIYNLYVYAHGRDVQPEWWARLEREVDVESISDYALAMALELAARHSRIELADTCLARLEARAQVHRGTAHWTTAGFSRWGDDRYEITAAVLKALAVHAPEHELVPKILSWFAETKRGGRWNSTRDTAAIVYAVCELLTARPDAFDGGAGSAIVVEASGGWRETVSLVPGETSVLELPRERLLEGVDRLEFHGAAPGAMFRAILRWDRRGLDVPSAENGLRVTRWFDLVDISTGQSVRRLESGESVPAGSYVRSTVAVERIDGGQEMSFLLVQNPKPSTCEILPVGDVRVSLSSADHALREDRTAGVAWHHERGYRQLHDVCVYRAELAGTWVAPAATAELFYESWVGGRSEPFVLVVEPDVSEG